MLAEWANITCVVLLLVAMDSNARAASRCVSSEELLSQPITGGIPPALAIAT